MTKYFPLALIILLLQACTLFIPKEQDLRDKVDMAKELTCRKPAKIQLLSSQEVINQNFHGFIKREGNKLNRTSQIAAWLLIQMNYRPDLTSKNSQFLAAIFKDGKTFVYNSQSKKYTYINFIQYFNSKFGGSHSLAQIAQNIKRYHPKNFKISSEFSLYLNKNIDKIKQSKVLSSHFLRGTEFLRKNERLKPLNFSKIVSKLSPLRFKTVKLSKKGGLYCNTSQFKTIPEDSRSNSFAIKIGSFSVLVSTSQNVSFEAGDNFFFKTSMSSFPKTICTFKDKVSAWLISDKGRSPYQHLDHLLQYQIKKSQDRKEFEEYLNFSRHLILKNPMRLIYESDRGTTEQLDKLLKFDIPIYYSTKLGNVFGIIKDKSTYLFKDNRTQSEIKCSN